MMKKVFMIAAMLCCTLLGFAEEKFIELEKDKRPLGRSEVLLPIASIDGQVLTVSFTSSTAFDVTIVDAIGVVVYTATFHAQGTTITLPNLLAGNYELVIEDATHVYSGEFEIAD